MNVAFLKGLTSGGPGVKRLAFALGSIMLGSVNVSAQASYFIPTSNSTQTQSSIRERTLEQDLFQSFTSHNWETRTRLGTMSGSSLVGSSANGASVSSDSVYYTLSFVSIGIRQRTMSFIRTRRESATSVGFEFADAPVIGESIGRWFDSVVFEMERYNCRRKVGHGWMFAVESKRARWRSMEFSVEAFCEGRRQDSALIGHLRLQFN
jgi:hypothetical protein